MERTEQIGPRICLLTGPPGCGKTTLVCRVVESLSAVRVAGFVTAEIREHGRRQGFTARCFNGETCVMAHRRIHSSQRVGAYGVNVAAFDRTVVAALESAQSPELYVLDEIGKMEAHSPRFVALVERLAAGHVPILATIPVTPLPLVVQLQQRADARLVRMDAASREAGAGEVTQWCRERGFSLVASGE